MNRTISNSELTVEIKQHGAELCSIRGADGIEYMWQADPSVWGRHSPVLFPIVGKLAGDRYSYNGKSYEMRQHGFARDLDFEWMETQPERASLRLLPSPRTRSQYPFEFELRRDYRLEGKSLHVLNRIWNAGKSVMPFSMGEHPGFSLTWGSGDTLEDYYLEFEKTETLDTALLDSNHLLSPEKERVLTAARQVPLRRDLFNRDALIFMELESQNVSLCSRKHQRRLSVSYPGFPYLGIWAKPGASFVCIEPWYGHADTPGHDGVLMNKPGIMLLDPGDTFQCEWTIEVEF